MKHKLNHQDEILLQPNEGRVYKCGSMTAVFKADENETANKHSISEWWLEPNSEGPGAHKHEENDEIFYGLAGTASVLVGDQWIDIHKGAFLRIPSNTIHDFANRTNERCGLLNVFLPGGFERNMPAIVDWFNDNQ